MLLVIFIQLKRINGSGPQCHPALGFKDDPQQTDSNKHVTVGCPSLQNSKSRHRAPSPNGEARVILDEWDHHHWTAPEGNELAGRNLFLVLGKEVQDAGIPPVVDLHDKLEDLPHREG